MPGLTITGTGRALPRTAVKNDDLKKWIDTDDEWITSRTGIKTRHFCTDGETVATLAAAAGAQAMQAAGITGEDLALCIVATFTPNYSTPSVACEVQQQLKLPSGLACFDLGAACSGFVYALQVAACMLPSMQKRYALVIGAEAISKVMDYTNRSTLVLFGDGAGAAVVELREGHSFYGCMHAAGDADVLYARTEPDGTKRLNMSGSAIFRFAVEAVPAAIREVAELAGVDPCAADYIVCHQANSRIIEHVADKMGIGHEKFYMNIDRYGNTSAASIPIALDEMLRAGLLPPGSKIICVGFGAGLTWGGVYLEF